MLRSMNEQLKYTVEALDGEAGYLHDFLIDERTWVVRYAVIDLGHWLPGRKVLLARPGIDGADYATKTLSLKTTKAQIEASPDLTDDAPVSRQYEQYLYEHYQWAPYWAPGFAGGGVMPMETATTTEPDSPPFKAVNPHLRSLRELTGYSIVVDEEHVGRVDAFMCYDDTWEVPFLVANVGGWFHKERLMVPTKRVGEIAFTEHRLTLNMRADTLDDLPTFDPEAPEAGRVEMCVYDYRGKMVAHEPVEDPHHR